MPEKIKVNDEKDTAVIQKCFMMCTYLYNYVDIFKVKEEKKKRFKYKLNKNTTTLVDYKIILN